MLIDKLHEKFPDMQNLRVRDIKVTKGDRRSVYCVISYPNGVELSRELVQDIKDVVTSELPAGYRADVKIVNDRFNEKSVVSLLCDLFKKKYPIFAHIKSDKIKVAISEFDVDVTFCVAQSVKRSMEISDFFTQLDDFFRWYTCYNFTFSVTVDEAAEAEDVSDEQEKLVRLAINRELMKPQRFFELEKVEKYIGKEIDSKPMYISDIRHAMDRCVVCGRISDKEIRASKTSSVLKMCKFTLTDDSQGTIPCVMFVRFQIEDVETLKQTNVDKTENEILTISKKKRLANEKKMKQIAFLGNGLEVLVRGKVVYNQFSDRLELQVYDLSKCKIKPLASQPQYERAVAANYILVTPTPIEEYRQMTLLQMEEKKSLLSDREYVVLCANVTGYNVTKDKFLAVCAVRVVDGHVKEKLYTTVLPETDVPDQLIRQSRIDESRLMVSPTITDIISDLYKFVGNAPVVGSDAARLLDLLNYYAVPLGYRFNNAVTSQFDMLSQLYDNSVFDGKPNCTVVWDVAKSLKLTVRATENCEDVAMALAKCMSVLAQNTK